MDGRCYIGINYTFNIKHSDHLNTKLYYLVVHCHWCLLLIQHMQINTKIIVMTFCRLYHALYNSNYKLCDIRLLNKTLQI